MTHPAQSITPRNRAEPAPLSHGQELFWLVDRANPGLVAYNVPRAFRVRGALDVDALERALNALIGRHEILRSTYRLDGDHPVQVVQNDVRVPFERIDLSGESAEAAEARTAALLRERAAYHFDLSRDVLLRATVVRFGANDHLFFYLSHHIVSDGWSKSLIFRDLSALYDHECGSAPALEPLTLQFADYAVWERNVLASSEAENHLEYWRKQLAAPLPVLELPTDRPVTGAPSFDGDHCEIIWPSSFVAEIRQLGQSQGASFYMTLLAAWQSLLHRYTGQDEIIVGSPIAGRGQEETENLVGYFANALAFRTRFDDDPTFSDLLARVADTCLDGYEHQELPFERLVMELKRNDAASHAPLFQVVLTMEDTVPGELRLGSAALTPVEVPLSGTKFDLTLLFSERPEGIRLALWYKTDRFVRPRIERMLGHLEQLLRGAVAEPTQRMSAVPLLTAAEAAALAAWEGPGVAFPATPVAARLAARAAATPTAPAVVSGATTLAYGALQRRATALAQALGAAGVGPGDRVGLLLEREAELLVGVQGIWLAGAGYVPLVPDLPPARRAALVAESGARVVVTTAALRERVPAGVAVVWVETAQTPTAAAVPGARPEALAYVLFTSGSTGVPKGVAVTHAQLAHYVEAISARLGLALDGSTPWTSASVSTLAADLGHTAVFPFLAAGGTVHLLPTAVAMEPAPWAAYSAAHRLDLLKIAPSHLKALVGDATGPALAALLPTRWLVVGGEPCPLPFAAALRAAGPCRVLNHYGPTETTVGACTYAPDEEPTPAETMGSLPIGRPLPNLRAEVRSAHGPVQPLGVPGELWVGGPQVAQGYLGRPDLTAERFTTDAAGRRWYRTGDRVRRLSTGALEFLGRLDAQVKVRGHRVELEEVERVLAAVPGVTQAAVRLHEDALAAYLVAAAPVTDAQLLQAAQAALPDYMVPSTWTRLPRLPLNANGKLDRAQLPAPEAAGPADGDGAAPQGPVEIQLAQLWAEVLKQDGLGRDANFFTLGGHSLLAIRLLGKLSKTFGVRLALRQLFEAPTIAQLAVVVDPPSVVETQLLGLWAEILKRDPVGRDANFFTLGGHSLLAIRLLGRISKTFGIRLSLRSLFDAPTPRQLAAMISPQIQPQGDSEDLAALLADLRQLDSVAAAKLLSEPADQGRAP